MLHIARRHLAFLSYDPKGGTSVYFAIECHARNLWLRHFSIEIKNTCFRSCWIKLVSFCCTRCFFRHLYVRWIEQESPIYHRVEKSLLYQNPLSVNSAKFFIFPLYYVIHFSHSFFEILKV